MTSKKHRVVWVDVKRDGEEEARAEARQQGVPDWLEPVVMNRTPWGAEAWLFEWDQPVPLPARAIAPPLSEYNYLFASDDREV